MYHPSDTLSARLAARARRGAHPLARLIAVVALAAATSLQAKVIVVTTTDNVSPAAGQTSLVQAINLLQEGDTIQFNISGTGPHYLLSPPGGYPIITNLNNITIDGYSQPGSSPNTNPILSSNNANITIVLDARNANFTTLANSIPGYGTSEEAILFVLGSTNFAVRGICFLGTWDYVNDPFQSYAVAFGGDQPSHYGHVSGCRIGLDLDGQTVARLKDGVTAFGSGANNGIVVGVAATATNAADARAQFNVIVGEQIPAIIEGNDTRLSGNFFNVYPDGLHDFLVDGQVSGPDHTLEAFIEIGSYGNNVVIGTDGDGVNDAEERNVFGGVTEADDHRILEWYGGTRTNTIVAGNYIGVGVDGITTFTNGGPDMEVIEGFNSTTTVQVGSDFDGVSDDIEANFISWNHPFEVLYPDPPNSLLSSRWRFAKMDTGARVSLRGNKLVNNELAPYTYANNSSGLLTAFLNYEAPYMDTTGNLIPTLDATNSIFPTLVGTFAPGIDPYTNIMIDVYQLDREGWNNGKTFGLAELTDSATYTNGFPQGSKFLGSFSVANTGSFAINLSGLDLGAGRVTVTANYSADPPRTHRGRTHTSNFSDPIALVPGGASTAGLSTVVPDVQGWYNTANPPSGMLGSFVLGPDVPANQLTDNSNWEPYTSVLGDSTFLMAIGTFADDQTVAGATYTGNGQRFIVLLQPARGGTPKFGEEFYTDAGAPFRGVESLSRNNGNPPRVAGDKRYGAVNFITAAETSAGQLAPFQSDNRWQNNPMASADNRYVTEQPFALNPGTLAQTPLAKAWDYVYGPYVTSTAPAGGNQLSRTGGRPEFLDNGNIVVMIDDKTSYANSAGEVTTFAIITPTGSVVKGPTLVDPHDIWDNMAAYRGGFAIRVHNLLYFYDNAGNLKSSIDINVSSGLTFGTGREDGSRIASDIRSYYVYLAGQTPETARAPVNVAIWDSRTGNFVAKATVDDIDTSFAQTDRVSLGVDGLDRFCVAYSFQPTPGFTKRQVAARVMAFDGTKISYLTAPFFPFVNHVSTAPDDATTQIETYHASVSMTPRQILIAAKGSLNSTNNPAAGQDTNPNGAGSGETKVFTVISHPVPVAPVQPNITVTRTGSNAILTWGPVDAGLFTVQWTSALNPSGWADVTPAPSVVQVGDTFQATIPVGSSPKFFRLARW